MSRRTSRSSPVDGGAAPAIGNSPILEATSAAARVLQVDALAGGRAPRLVLALAAALGLRVARRLGEGQHVAAGGPEEQRAAPPISPLAPAATRRGGGAPAGGPPPPSPAPAEARAGGGGARRAVVAAVARRTLTNGSAGRRRRGGGRLRVGLPGGIRPRGPVGPGGFFALLWITDVFLWLDVAAGFVALPPPSAPTTPSTRQPPRRRTARWCAAACSPMPSKMCCRFPYDLFACAGRGAPFAFGAGHIARLLLLRRAWAIVANRFESPRAASVRRLGHPPRDAGRRLVVGPPPICASRGSCRPRSPPTSGRRGWRCRRRARRRGSTRWNGRAGQDVRSLDRAPLIVTGEGRRGERTRRWRSASSASSAAPSSSPTSPRRWCSSCPTSTSSRRRPPPRSAASTFCKGSKLPAEVSRRIRAHTCHPDLTPRIPPSLVGVAPRQGAPRHPPSPRSCSSTLTSYSTSCPRPSAPRWRSTAARRSCSTRSSSGS